MSDNLAIAYLVTNENDVSFPEYQWSNNTTHTQENPNYFFYSYKDLNVAKFIQPCLDQKEKPNYWKVKLSDITHKDPMRIVGKKCEAIEKCDTIEPNNEQRFNFASLLSLNYTKNKVFVEWVMKYLKNEDRTFYTANVVTEKLRLKMLMELPKEETYLSSTHALVKAVLTGNYNLYCAASAHKLIWDAPSELNVASFASAAMTLDTSKVIELIESAF